MIIRKKPPLPGKDLVRINHLKLGEKNVPENKGLNLLSNSASFLSEVEVDTKNVLPKFPTYYRFIRFSVWELNFLFYSYLVDVCGGDGLVMMKLVT